MELYSPFNYSQVEAPQFQMSSTSMYQSSWSGSEYVELQPVAVPRRAKPGGGTGGQDTENPYIKTDPVGSGVGVLMVLLLCYACRRYFRHRKPALLR